MTTRQDLIVRQGETWAFVWTKTDSAGAAVNITGYTARMSVKDCYNGSLMAYLSTGADANGGSIALGGALGTVTLSMTATQTAALANTLSAFAFAVVGEGAFFDISKPTVRFIYDLELISGAGAVTRELQGQFMVQREVTT